MVGLGNPGDSYDDTRHNAGFRVVEALAAQEGIRIRSRQCRSRVGRGNVEGSPVLLALPQTYMNASGEAVSALCKKNKGIASIVSALGTSDFPRLRVGIRGERYSRERDLGDYVLEPFAKGERAIFEDAIGRAVEALRVWLAEGIDAAMRSANPKPSSPAPASEPD
ncbi:MAG: aminoacyl-tRNA hydrolase [Acidobacteria bacterium]|nr:aminoacyl-tRNA hydrolase [Acidobacteriota bacterium]